MLVVTRTDWASPFNATLRHALRWRAHANVGAGSNGDRKSRVFLIKHGHVTIVRHADEDNEIITGILGPGEFFGQLNYKSHVSSSGRVCISGR